MGAQDTRLSKIPVADLHGFHQQTSDNSRAFARGDVVALSFGSLAFSNYDIVTSDVFIGAIFRTPGPRDTVQVRQGPESW